MELGHLLTRSGPTYPEVSSGVCHDFIKIRPVGTELFHADRRTCGERTDMTKLIVAFRNFANAPKNM